MKILHTADLHLGRQLLDFELLDDQRHILNKIVEVVRSEHVDLLIIAGDIFDRSIPPASAMSLANDFFEQVLGIEGTEILLINGNHDNAERLSYFAGLVKTAGLHIYAQAYDSPSPFCFERQGESICIYPLVYIDPQTDNFCRQKEITSHRDYYKLVCQEIGEFHRSNYPNKPSVLVAHSFVEGGRESDSERPLSVGGLDRLDPQIFSHFDYIALGHLHFCHSVAKNAWYSGSPLAYSLSETDQDKFVLLLDTEAGLANPTKIKLNPLKELKTIEASFEDICNNPRQYVADPDHCFLAIALTDETLVYQNFARLREVFPFLVHVQNNPKIYEHLTIQSTKDVSNAKNDLDLIVDFLNYIERPQLAETHKSRLETMIKTYERETL